MAPKCYICNYYDSKIMSLFRVPNRNDEYSERASMWLKLLDEKKENLHKIRICSEHFLKSINNLHSKVLALSQFYHFISQKNLQRPITT